MIEIIISYYSRQMGQEQTMPQPHSARNYHFQSNTEIKNQFKSNQSKEHEGILKLRSTPFPDCVQISNDGMLLFLQNAQATLQQLLENRLYTNRLFPLQDVEKLIESIVYTLAYLSESNIVYRDLCPANIYYCDGVFKLLPNQLIEQQFYDKAYQNFYGLHQNEQQADFSYLSPELIIALRMKQKQVLDFDILSKSNVFIFGLILLESTTLLPSSQCYDPSNYDIFNNVISQRLDLVQQHYNQCIARIIANMLDYDFNQRMDIKQLSIWINRELMTYRKQLRKSFETEEKKTLNPNKSSVVLHKSRFVTHEAQKQVAQQSSPVVVQEPQSNPSRSYSRSNMVYIKGYDDNGKEDAKPGDALRGAKNCIYLQALPQYEVDYQLDKKIEQRNHQLQTDIRSRIPPTNLYAQNRNSYSQHHNIYTDNREARTYLQSRNTIIENRNPYQESRSYQRGSNKFNYQLEQKNLKHGAETDTCYSQENRLNRDYSKPAEKASFVPYIAPQPTQSTFLREVANIRAKIQESEPNMTKSGQNSEFMKDQNAITAKLRNQNKFYPCLSELQNAQRQTESTKRIAKHSEVGRNSRAKQCFDSKQSKQSDSKCSVNDGSINRIKLEIQKSRKLIEEFRKTEGLVQ